MRTHCVVDCEGVAGDVESGLNRFVPFVIVCL